MKLAIVILNYNGKALLERFLPSSHHYKGGMPCPKALVSNFLTSKPSMASALSAYMQLNLGARFSRQSLLLL